MIDIRCSLKNIIVSFICLVAMTDSIFAQAETNFMRPGQVKKHAKMAAAAGDIFTAIDMYEAYLAEKPDNIKIVHELGNLYYREKNYQKAVVYLEKAFQADQDKYLIDLYYCALALKSLGEYKKAEDKFVQMQKLLRKSKLRDDYSRIVKLHVESFKELESLQKQTERIVVTHLDTNINKPHIQFSPIPTNDGKLIYASLKQDELKYYDPNTDELPVRKFYVAEETNGKWKNLGEFNELINGENVNTGNGAFSASGNKFYFTRCEKNERAKVICKIFMSVLKDNEWQEPTELCEKVNMPNYTSTMPSLGISRRNTDILYFVSDRPGGRGGLDIWYSIFNTRKNEFEVPRNCGKLINTEGNEITPYYNIDTKTLYFSSDLHPGLGGYDVFKASGEGRQWESLENMGGGINSSFDELYYVLTPNRQKGYFTS
ncbi:MAG: hypothetical protein GX879_03510, partial [Bacteroidales bacterium]|nr:hypothetical protein [Bacteroidales bacterium]